MDQAKVYQLPRALVVRVIAACLTGRRRSFREDALECMKRLQPPLAICGLEHVPSHGPCLVTANHFTRPGRSEEEGIGAWWLALGISACLPAEVHWILTAGWTYPDWWRSHTLTPLSKWLFDRLAQVYGFTTMPPMPPRPHEVSQRARAVRQVLNYARQVPEAWIGLAPEGRDIPGGVLGEPPPGVGRFMLLLNFPVLPVGVYAIGLQYYVNFGFPFTLDTAGIKDPDERDRLTSDQVMRAIAALLPEHLRGRYHSSQ